MKRFLVERTFAHGLDVRIDDAGRQACRSVVAVNAPWGVTWIRSYVSPDGRKTFCLYEAPSAQAIREVAERNALPVDRITEVSVLWPFTPTPAAAAGPRTSSGLQGPASPGLFP